MCWDDRLGVAEHAYELAGRMLDEIEPGGGVGARPAAAGVLRGMDRSAVLRRALAAGDDRARGGEDVLGQRGEPSRATTWEEVLALEPELVIVGPCGFGATEAAERAAALELPCPAVAVDGDAYYSRPAPRLAAGVRQLAYLLHPDVAPDPGLPAIPLSNQAASPTA